MFTGATGDPRTTTEGGRAKKETKDLSIEETTPSYQKNATTDKLSCRTFPDSPEKGKKKGEVRTLVQRIGDDDGVEEKETNSYTSINGV